MAATINKAMGDDIIAQHILTTGELKENPEAKYLKALFVLCIFISIFSILQYIF